MTKVRLIAKEEGSGKEKVREEKSKAKSLAGVGRKSLAPRTSQREPRDDSASLQEIQQVALRGSPPE